MKNSIEDSVPEWVKLLSQNQSFTLKDAQCAEHPAYIGAWEQFPYKPFYMRGKNYMPVDLNVSNRESFVLGAKYQEKLIRNT